MSPRWLPIRSGAPSATFGACCAAQHAVGSWNARGLLAVDSGLRRRKLSYLGRLVKATSILGLQEAHGTFADMVSSLKEFASERVVVWTSPGYSEAFTIGEDKVLLDGKRFDSPEALGYASDMDYFFEGDHHPTNSSSQESESDTSLADSSAGSSCSACKPVSACASASSTSRFAGCITFIDPRIFPSTSSFKHVVLVPGRCIETTITHADCTSVYINTHLFDWSPIQIDFVSKQIKDHLNKARDNPTSYHVTLLGDWNWRCSDKPVLDTVTGQAIFGSQNCQHLLVF